MNFDSIYEQVYNVFNINKRPVMYTAPDEDPQFVEQILRFIETDTLLVTKLNELNDNPESTHQQYVEFLNDVKRKSFDLGKLTDIPLSVWENIRDYAFSRIYADKAEALEPAWDNGPSTIEAFDDLMKQRDPEARIPFKAYFSKQYKKGLGKDHIFHRMKKEAENATNQNQTKEPGGELEIEPGLA